MTTLYCVTGGTQQLRKCAAYLQSNVPLSSTMSGKRQANLRFSGLSCTEIFLTIVVQVRIFAKSYNADFYDDIEFAQHPQSKLLFQSRSAFLLSGSGLDRPGASLNHS
jgi:hypothetical protein